MVPFLWQQVTGRTLYLSKLMTNIIGSGSMFQVNFLFEILSLIIRS